MNSLQQAQARLWLPPIISKVFEIATGEGAQKQTFDVAAQHQFYLKIGIPDGRSKSLRARCWHTRDHVS